MSVGILYLILMSLVLYWFYTSMGYLDTFSIPIHYMRFISMTAEFEETLRNIKSEIDLLVMSKLPEDEYNLIAKIEDLVDDAIYHEVI